MKKILVTGGAGYIGSHAVRALCEHGVEVVVLDNFATGRKELVWPGAELMEVDLCDAEGVEAVFLKYEIEAVLHFAALSSVEESMREPDLYFKNNLEGTRNLLNAMERHGVRQLVFSSTAAVYGVPEKLPITEKSATHPINPYGESKLACEVEMLARAEKGVLDCVILRYFNVAGASLDQRLGEMREHETHLIPLVLSRGIRGESVKIFGTDYATRDGTCVRDYIHVLDLVDAHLRALDFLAKEKGAHIFNLGSGEGFSVREIITVCEFVAEREFAIVEEARREGDPPVLVAETGLAKKELKWLPQYSLEEIVRSTYEWLSRKK